MGRQTTERKVDSLPGKPSKFKLTSSIFDVKVKCIVSKLGVVTNNTQCYRLNSVHKNSYFEVLTPVLQNRTSCGQCPCRCN